MKNIKVLQQQLKEVNEDLKPLFEHSSKNFKNKVCGDRALSSKINTLLKRKYNLQININQSIQQFFQINK
jgi:hypothetical protein